MLKLLSKFLLKVFVSSFLIWLWFDLTIAHIKTIPDNPDLSLPLFIFLIFLVIFIPFYWGIPQFIFKKLKSKLKKS